MVPGVPSIGGVDTGGGSLDAGSSASSQSGDFTGGNRSFSFAGATINKAPSTNQILMYAGIALAAWVVIKKVK